MHFVCIILPGINNTFAYLKIYSDNFTIDFANQCVFIIVTIGSFLIELFLLIYHPFLRRNFFRLLCSLFCCRMFFPINKVMQVPPTTDTNILTQSNIRTGKDGPKIPYRYWIQHSTIFYFNLLNLLFQLINFNLLYFYFNVSNFNIINIIILLQHIFTGSYPDQVCYYLYFKQVFITPTQKKCLRSLTLIFVK
uniref:Uncharacterized protein n=1 Tax=Meloidogyne enterolobii TaxID=390850 RepID=A0A6V7XDH3_MELEN|nr:unnamed protein product [Meloidogyne enterolobii]